MLMYGTPKSPRCGIKSSLAQLVRQWTSDPELRCKVGVQAQVKTIGTWGGGGGRVGDTWIKFCWVCAAGFSEPLPHYSLFCGQL